MADQSFLFVERKVKDVSIQIDDHYVPTDFLVIDMGKDECDPPIILGILFLNTIKAIIYIGTGEIHFKFPSEKVLSVFSPRGVTPTSKFVCMLPFPDGDAR
jgi:hypothetical protein